MKNTKHHPRPSFLISVMNHLTSLLVIALASTLIGGHYWVTRRIEKAFKLIEANISHSAPILKSEASLALGQNMPPAPNTELEEAFAGITKNNPKPPDHDTFPSQTITNSSSPKSRFALDEKTTKSMMTSVKLARKDNPSFIYQYTLENNPSVAFHLITYELAHSPSTKSRLTALQVLNDNPELGTEIAELLPGQLKHEVSKAPYPERDKMILEISRSIIRYSQDGLATEKLLKDLLRDQSAPLKDEVSLILRLKFPTAMPL